MLQLFVFAGLLWLATLYMVFPPMGPYNGEYLSHIPNPLCQLIKIYCILRKVEYLSLSSIKGSHTFLWQQCFRGISC